MPGSIFRMAVLKHETNETVEFDVTRNDSNGLMILDALMTNVAILTKDIETVEIDPLQSGWAQILALTDDIRIVGMFHWSPDEMSRHQAHVDDLECSITDRPQPYWIQTNLQHDLDASRASEAAARETCLPLQDMLAAQEEQLAEHKLASSTAALPSPRPSQPPGARRSAPTPSTQRRSSCWRRCSRCAPH
jgi:hypothetical protein